MSNSPSQQPEARRLIITTPTPPARQADLDLEVHRLTQWASDNPGALSVWAGFLGVSLPPNIPPEVRELHVRLAAVCVAADAVGGELNG